MTETHPHQDAFSTGENVLLTPVEIKKCETCQESAWMTKEQTKCKTCSERKPFSKFTQVVKGLTSIDGMDIAMYYAKRYYNAELSAEENIDFISDIIEQDL